jgi:hypothetical protein
MNKLSKIIISLLFLSASPSLASTTFGRTTFINRPAGQDKILQEANTLYFWAPADTDCLNGYASILAEYNHSFDRDETGKYLFFNGTNTMTFGTVNYITPGVQTAALPGVDFFVENIFLNNNAVASTMPGYSAKLTTLPDVTNVVVDIDFHLNFDEWVCGLCFDIHAPINWTRWDMNFRENDLNAGVNIIANTFGNTMATPSPITTLKQGFNGQVLDTADFPLLKQKLNFGRVDGAQTKTRLADVEAALGYNFLGGDCYHFGIDIRAIFPTGNRPDANFWFQPVVGNGHHVEVGVGASGHYELWNNGCDSSFNIWANGKVFHMFRAKQRRLFDLLNSNGTQNIGSNRLLIKKFTGAPATPALSEILYGPNVLALQCRVKNDVHAEVVALFDYQRCAFTFDAGYKFWVRTKDKITISEQLPPNTYGIKGASTSADTNTASNTDIKGNSMIDTTPVYLTNANLSIQSAEQPTALTHGAFVILGYAWDLCDYTPFVGVGGEVEFSGKDNNALDVWGVWAKAGFAFS